MKKFSPVLLSLLLFSSVGSVFAARFSDVPQGHLYFDIVESLVDAGLIQGYADGTFRPDAKVNRAEMLKMLYKATGKNPDASSHDCFPDIESGSWYEAFVCDAAAQHYVAGYSDGSFKPGNSVNRVESIKMITQVMGIPVEEVGEEARQVVKFVDVSISAWYTKFLYAAYVKGILPIPGQDAARFYPDWPLLRGEAAAMIFNSLKVDLQERRQSSSSSSSSASSVASTGSGASSASSAAGTVNVPFPFDVSGKFTVKKPLSYHFTLDSNETVSIESKLQAGQPGSLSCRLYLLGSEGFSFEYYLGFVEGNSCTLKVALRPGEYQLQLQPTFADTTFTVVSKKTTGDGNDGFREAQALLKGVARTGTLASGDVQDWFTFTVGAKTGMEVTVSDSTQLTCMIYAMEDVELADFAGPQCNQRYQFPPGTYYVSVGREFPLDSKQTYTVVQQ